MIYKSDHDTTQASKNICYTKIKGTVDYRTVNRWFEKFGSSYKNLDD